ncbi:MAG: alpha/beta fold hydrolase, partial [Devosia sp.]
MIQPTEQIRFCTSEDGTRIAYGVCGTGPPLVWVAHWMHHLEHDWDSPVWRSWLKLLSRRHTLIRYDQSGCGLSDRRRVEFSADKLSEDFLAVVDAAGLSRFDLFAMTACARVIVPFAVRHADRIGKLVLYGTSGRGPLAPGASAAEIEETETRLKAIELGWYSDTPAYGQFFAALHIPDASHEQAHSYNELLRLTTSPGNATSLLRTFLELDVRHFLPRITSDTLVLHTRRDSILPFSDGREVAALIPGARFVPLEGRNHILLSTDPAWQKLCQALEEFFPSLSESAVQTFDSLTARERDVVELVAQGMSNGDVAALLGVSEKTVRNSISIIFSKTGVVSRARLIV